jgi:glycyl-tRNA synthetase
MGEVTMEKIVQLCKTRGFVFPGSEIYGGMANSWDYGPLGAQLRRNIKNDWWKRAVEARVDVVGLDGSILTNPRVLESSGHLAKFDDPMVEDLVTHKRYRADHLIEPVVGGSLDGKTPVELTALIAEHGIKSPDGNKLGEVKSFNLLFETGRGKTEETKSTVYLRPETAQAIFPNFRNVLESTRKRLPFGIAQIGKAFRNEITPGNFIFRTLEFEQMEIEYFCEADEWEVHFEKWRVWMTDWAKSIGLAMDRFHEEEIDEESRAFYSERTIDFEFDFPFGKKELWGLAYRTDHDLKSHQEGSGQKLEYTDPNDQSRKFLPHVIEPSQGVDRTLLALLVSAYTEEEVNESTRVVMKFKPQIAPYHIAVLPLQRKDELTNKAQEVRDQLLSQFRVDYDVTQSIGKRYRRQDEIGTLFCVTIDFESLEDGQVTVRDRDTMEQERIAITHLDDYFRQKLV